MKIISLEAENVKRLKAVSLTFKDGVTVIGGRNGQGKSSCLDTIAMALGGEKLVCEAPLRKGESSGHATVTLGEPEPMFRVTRRFTAKGTTSLTVEAADGSRPKTPQTLLDGLLGSLTFDPLAFSRMDPKRAADVLRELVGLDTSQIESDIKAAEEARVVVTREVSRLEGALKTAPHHEGVGTEEQSVTAIADELKAADDAAKKRDDLTHTAADRRKEASVAAERAKTARERIDTLRKEIAECEEKARLGDEGEKAALRAAETKDTDAAAVQVPDRHAIRDRLKGAEAVNTKVRENKVRAGVDLLLRKEREKHDSATRKIDSLREQRQKMIRDAAFPVEGLGLDETGVKFGGLPFEQAASSEQLRVSVAMGLAMNPRLKLLLIRDGSLLDDANLAMIGQMADAAGAQILIERVGKDASTSVVIEDGEVIP